MQYILINATPILLATLGGLVVSVLYALAVRRGESMGRGARLSVGLAFIAEGWLACILAGALILAPHQAGAWTMAIGSAVVIWIGFILPALFVTLRFRGSAMGPALADSVIWLAVMLVQAGVLQLVGLVRPR
jgi:hypothetical protein